MPIRINLLAEAQATAELRRKDPVKRGIWVGSFLVLVVLLWIAKLQLDISYEKSNYNGVESEWKSKMTKYTAVTNQQVKIGEVDRKLAQLDALHTNRFLWAPVLNALQKTVLDQVRVTKLIGGQTYGVQEGHYIGSGSTRVFVPGGVTAKVNLSIDAEDLRPNEENYTKYKEALCSYDFFATRLKRRDGFVLDGVLGQLMADPVDPNRQFRTFTLASHFPEEIIGE